MAEVVRIMLNEAMQIERSRVIEAEPYQRSEHRKGYANGYKPKTLKTRLGEITYLILDARYEKVRHGGSVVSCAVRIAVGITADGHRSLLRVRNILLRQNF
jgi:transposase-like protein